METDRELLEKAAKAAGIAIKWDSEGEVSSPLLSHAIGDVPWNPLDDDGDALRLAVKLGLTVITSGVNVKQTFAYEQQVYAEAETGDDPYAATRRAIVRAAAALGEKP